MEMEDYFPIMEVSNNCIVSKRGDITIAFEMTLPEIFTKSASDYEQMHHDFVQAMKLLPAGTLVHKQDWFEQAKYEAKFSASNEKLSYGNTESFLSNCSNRYFNERPFLAHRCYIFLTKLPDGAKEASSLFNTLTRPFVVPRQVLGFQHVEEFEDQCNRFAHMLTNQGILTRRLGDEEIYSHRRKIGLIERYMCLHGISESDSKIQTADQVMEENASYNIKNKRISVQNDLTNEKMDNEQTMDQMKSIISGPGSEVIRDILFKDELQVGAYYCQMFSLADAQDLPSFCGSRMNYDPYCTDNSKFSIGFASSLGLLLPCNHIYNQYILIEDVRKTLKKLESKRLRLQSLSAYSRENALTCQSIGEFLNECISDQRIPVKAHFNVLAWTPQKDQIKHNRNLISTALSVMDATAKEEFISAAQLFWAAIPGNAGDLPLNECFDTFLEQACCFFNMETNYQDSLSPIGIRLGDRLTGKPIHVDISDEPVRNGICVNRNKFILGPSGSGKSFFTNHMVRTYYEQGAHVVLVDVGHSYRGLCDMVGGYYFTYDETSPLCFNPFYIEQESYPDTEKKESIKSLLLALWKKGEQSYSRSEYVALSNALQGYYKWLQSNVNVFACFNSFYEYLKTDFVEELNKEHIQEKDFDVHNFLYVLKPYYNGGEYDYLLNASQNLDMLHERFIVFELDNIKEHPILFPVVTIIIMEVFISKMRKLKGVRKMILIEEAWKAIAKEGMAEYIKYLFKTVRKFFGEAIVVTQEIDDIISSPVVKQTIINNSDCKILLDQSKYQNKFEQIQEMLGLTDKEKSLILSINKANDIDKKYKEVFISLGGTLSKVYRVEVSLEEYYIYTTEEKEKWKLQQYIEKYGSFENAIRIIRDERLS